MGKLGASVRQPTVAVAMAPALTDAAQSQNFQLPPPPHSSPISPLGVGLVNGNLEKGSCISPKKAVCQTDILSTYSVSSQREFDNLTTLALASELFKESGNHLHLNSDKEPAFGGDKTSLSSSGHSEGCTIMNNCDPSVVGEENIMGLQKANTGMPMNSANMKEKNMNSDSGVDQLLKNLGAAISGSDLGSNADIGTHVDDLLQVFEEISSGTTDASPSETGGTRLGSVIGPGGIDSMGTEEEAIYPLSGSGDVTGLSTLLNEVDMMSMCADVNLSESLETVNREAFVYERIKEGEKKQKEIERKFDRLIRRVHKVHVRGMGKQIGEEIPALLDYFQSILAQAMKGINADCKSLPQSGISSLPGSSSSPDDLKAEFLQKENVKNLSTSALVNLVRRLEMSQSVSNSVVGGDRGSVSEVPKVIIRLNSEVSDKVERTAGQLHTQLKMVESALDSDATESSSGGESCDELENYDDSKQNFKPIVRRAAYEWARSRSAVAARWTWLQAQISDLEYKIRQQNDIHRQIRAAKGTVIVPDSPVPTQSPQSSSVPVPSAPTTVPLPEGICVPAGCPVPLWTTPPVVNGYHGPAASSPSSSHQCQEQYALASRTRPLARGFRKRRLLHATGLHHVSKKAARLPSVRCGCALPLPACTLCAGRPHQAAPVEPDVTPINERVSFLDSAFHHVLSFSRDIPLSLHLEATMRGSDWQQRVLRTTQRQVRATLLAAKRDKEGRSKKHVEHRKKYTSRLKKTATNTLTAKLRKKLAKDHKTRGRSISLHTGANRHTLERLKRKRQAAKLAMAALQKAREEEEEELGSPLDYSGSKPSSPSSSPIPGIMAFGGDASSKHGSGRGSVLHDLLRRKRENSYDIDNIVIPYSVAASTRVEKLQYKEILTPKWRFAEEYPPLNPKNNGVVRRTSQSQDSDVEDISDEMYVSRHDRCEVEEKKKFLSYVTTQPSGRGRSRRADSRAESSGANTPDPMSPHMLDHLTSDTGSPMVSPPATPLSVHEECTAPSTPSLPVPLAATPVICGDSGLVTSELGPGSTIISCPTTVGFEVPGPGTLNSLCLALKERRRTTSQSRWGRERASNDELRCPTPDATGDETYVTSYDARIFPLIDEAYDDMVKEMPEGHPFLPAFSPKKNCSKDNDGDQGSRPPSPCTDSTESAVDDPNDPEWTVEDVKEERTKTSIVLKLSKR